MRKQLSAKRIRFFLSTVALLLYVLAASVMPPGASSSALFGGKPSVVLQASKASIIIPCPPGGGGSASGTCPSDAKTRLTAFAINFGKQPSYVYTVGAGQIIGEGDSVIWDFSGAGPGTYQATVEVRDGRKRRAVSSVTVTVTLCTDCIACGGLCPQLMVTCYDEVKAGTPITCKVVMNPASHGIIYNWTAHTGSFEDLSSTLTSRDVYVSIPTNGLAGQTVVATVEAKGIDSSCNTTASGSTKVRP